MLPTRSNRSYSEFFTSGYHSMANGTKRRLSTIPARSPITTSLEPIVTTNSKRRLSLINFTNRRSNPQPPPPSASRPSMPPTRTKRSSIIALSSWLKTPARSDNYLSFSRSPSQNKQELLGPPKFSASTDDINLFQQIDPFSASPNSKSFFIDLTDSSPVLPTRATTAKRESFLSMSGSSDRPFLRLRLPSLKRERPTSIHTMPPPSRSRRSSFRAESKYRSNYSFTSSTVEEEEQRRAPTPEPRVEDFHEWSSDPAQHIDWREFHVQVLCVGNT